MIFRSMLTFALAAVLTACAARPSTVPAPPVVAAPQQAAPSAAAPWFPFTIAGISAASGAVDLSALNDAPAGAHGPVRVEGGHFVDGRGGRIRFFGINVTGAPSFPDRETARKVAAHFRRLGVNVVRFHYVDHAPAPAGLLAGDGESLDPAQLERLDFFVAALADAGIYTNLNLHVARAYPGMTAEAKKRFPQGKVLGRFFPAFLASQRRFARALLSHHNPHRGRTYASDPAVVAVELNNEDTLLPFWAGNTDDLPDPYGAELRRQWNAWLARKYRGTDELRRAWAGGGSAGRELLANADLGAGTAGWTFESAGGPTRGEVIRDRSGPILRYHAPAAGSEPWHLQLTQSELPLDEGEIYTLRLRARAVQPAATRPVDVVAMLGVPDWRNVGLARAVELGPTWRMFELSFRATRVVAGKTRLAFQLRNQPGVIDLADLSLRKGAPPFALPSGQRLERGTVACASSTAAGPRAADWTAFLIDTERASARALKAFLRDELGVTALVSDSQANYGGLAGLGRELAVSDFVDMHGYWQHPAMPDGWGKPTWTIENTSQTAARDGGTLGFIAGTRVAGRPFTVSEYNTPSPNDHAAETLPLYAALAGFQDWDGIYLYTWLDFRNDWDASRILGFFDYAGHAGKLVFAPLAAMAFRTGLVAAGRQPLTLSAPLDATAPTDMRATGTAWRAAGAPHALVAVRRLQVAPGGSATPTVDGQAPPLGSPSDTGELRWRPDPPKPRFTVAAPAVRIATGAIAEETIALGDVTVTVGPLERGHATVGIVALDGQPVASSKRVLIAAAARVENSGMKWNAGRKGVGEDWGTGPTRAERVPLMVTVPGTGWRATALDGAGARASAVPVTTEVSSSSVDLRRSDTLWWLLERR